MGLIHRVLVLFLVFYKVFPPKLPNGNNRLDRKRGTNSADSLLKGDKFGVKGDKFGVRFTDLKGDKFGVAFWP